MKALHRLGPLFMVTTLLALASVEGAPQPTKAAAPPLKDYLAQGEILVRLPGTSAESGKAKTATVGAAFIIQVLQGYVAPDRYALQWNLMDGLQTLVLQGDVEYDWSPRRGFLLRTRYRNLSATRLHPSPAYTFSLRAMQLALQGLKARKEVPPGEALARRSVLEAQRTQIKKHRDELIARGKAPGVSKEIYARITREADRAGEELAEVVSDLHFHDVLQAYPCVVKEFDNGTVLRALSQLSTVGPTAARTLGRGTTRIWFTRQYALPVRVEMRDARGDLVQRLVIKALKINSGLSPDQLATGAPKNARELRVTTDLSRSDWARRRDLAIASGYAKIRNGGAPTLRQPTKGVKRGRKRRKIKPSRRK